MAGHYQDTVEDVVSGRPVNGATILVYEDGATISEDGRSVLDGTLASIFSDDGITAIDQENAPLTTGFDGEFDFYTAESRVVVAVLYNGEGKIVWNDQDILGGSTDSDVTALQTRVDNHDTLLGYPANTTNLGTFTGSIITDNTSLAGALQELETAIEGAASGDVLEWMPNFTDDGEVRIYASEAMTITQQGTSGTGSVSYEKSTSAAPSAFSSTSSPITLESGAWLKVIASSVSTIYAVALKRTA